MVGIADYQNVVVLNMLGYRINVDPPSHGWKEDPIGKVDRDKLNRLRGSIAIGHPFAATEARIVTQLANEMARTDSRYGLVSICGVGDTAAAMALERT